MSSREKIQAVIDEMGKVVIGQERLINRLLVGLFTGGHVLLEGVPGLAKTLTINTLAKILDLHFHRIQFTPDLLPADLVGTMIYNPKKSEFEVKKGPIFAQIILADEINRAPAKVQSALLEAMAEKQVTIGDTTYPLDKPFLVLATQNPVEQEGTFPLPEAQVDRFMLKVFLNYLDKDQELAVMRQKSNMDFNYEPKTVLNAEDIAKISKEINEITISETLEKYIIELVFATRNPAEYGLTQEAGYIQFGASPRASIQLNLAAKVMAYLEGRDYVLPEDIKEMAPDILNHRIILNYVAEADNITTLQIIQSILSSVAINR
ncbi:AAA family ATPase [Aquirufa antheringensis]|jgi:MoxR-like ATPase|uniref:AAA family ATPase n=1 Tax=Aquirufa antheringensis TaxID=2516559 RepID=UPI001032CE4A|nr:MoxR family ATPase [Aquirufa antheringensis]MCE4215840.1 AAA domain-containing protein [Pseudarcicella sp. GAP-15]MCL9968128.1 MoxR family ATPase [Aquirufa antheringensis]MCZ2477462.1 MoxR family ATPase [Aquirufa antheringensis]TBH70193.1 MoxR family ATPase [Aquirufa antheringensis]USQ03840.1 MoxR family ATPase [Aquirufa antheringensis]